jgi:hypothetical protein
VAEFSHPSFKKDRIAFSTAPSKRYHSSWAPTIFYTDKELPVRKGERIRGIFNLKFADKEKVADGEVDIYWHREDNADSAEHYTYKLF